MPKPLSEAWRHTVLKLYGLAHAGLSASGQLCGPVQVELDRIAKILAKELGCETKDLIEEPEPPSRSAEYYKITAYRDSLPRPGKCCERNGD